MTKRITFSDEHLSFDDVNEHHEIVLIVIFRAADVFMDQRLRR